MSSSPTTVGVVFGGCSGEHDVSIRSAQTVAKGLTLGANRERYRVVLVYIDREGRWWGPDLAGKVLSSGCPPADSDLPQPLPAPGFRGLPAGTDVVAVWYPVLHGPNGEDGTIQGLFELMQQPYVGAGVLGSAVSMDKQAMKAALSGAGLNQVPYVCAQADELSDAARLEALLNRIEAGLGYPCFIKPANLGSSVGISKARTREELLQGLRLAATLDPRLVVEQGVQARELECAVLGGTILRASVVGEVRFDADWYDYETKYTAGRSTTLIPAPCAQQHRRHDQEPVHPGLRCRGRHGDGQGGLFLRGKQRQGLA